MRKPIQYVEIIRDKCIRSFGVSPCNATGAKCFNTIGTCKFLSAYNGTTQKDIFINPDNGDASVYAQLGADSVYPFLRGVSHTPATINPASAGSGSSSLGTRATVKISLMDAAADDQHQDPYFHERSVITRESGTFFTKYFARNKYLQYRQINWVNAEIDEAGTVVNKKTRVYLITDIAGPDGRGNVSMTAQDPLCLVEFGKVQIPKPTSAILYADITDSQTSITLSPDTVDGRVMDLSDYSSTFLYVRIGDEILIGGTRSGSSSTWTGFARGAHGTTKEAHSEGDVVQVVYRWNTTQYNNLKSILNMAGIADSFLDLTQWNAVLNNPAMPWLQQNINVLIPEPTDASQVIADFSRLTNIVIYFDEDVGKIRVKANAASTVFTPDFALNSVENFIADTFSVKREDAKALTRVNAYIGVRSFAQDLKDPSNYHSRITLLAGDEESQSRRGKVISADVFCPWLTDSQADLLARNTLRQFAESPARYSFELDAKDAVKLGDYVSLSHRNIVDAYGATLTPNSQIIKAQEKTMGTTWAFEAVNYSPYPMPDFQGHYFIFIPVSANNIDLHALFKANRPSVTLQSGDTVTFVVGNGVTIGSSSMEEALHTGNWPAGVTVVLDCTQGGIYIVGRGGNGGNNEQYYNSYDYNLVKGTAGGDAFSVTNAITIVGSPVIGGGGAGGFGGFGTRVSGTYNIMSVGGGGGGGAGSNTGVGGIIVKDNGFGGTQQYAAQAGNNGTRSAGGAGGAGERRIYSGDYLDGGAGQNGGSLGQSLTRGGITIEGGSAVTRGNNLLTAPDAIFYGARLN